jgi:hypothetical protein
MAAIARPSLTLAGAIGHVVIVHAVANPRTGIPPAYLHPTLPQPAGDRAARPEA